MIHTSACWPGPSLACAVASCQNLSKSPECNERMNTNRMWLRAGVLVLSLSVSPWALADLPADIEADRLVLAAEEKIAQQDYDSARDYLERVGPLKAEPRPVYYYLFGQVLLRDGSLEKAQNYLADYVAKVGREGEHYDDALRLLTQIEEQLASRTDVGERQDLSALSLTGGDSEGKAYDDKVRKLFLSASLQDALVMHINSLLKSYVYLEGKVKNPDLSDRESYSVSQSGRTDIVVSRTLVSQDAGGQAQLSTDKLGALGVSPFVSYRCSKAVDSCVIRHPVTGGDWMRIAYDEAGARELSTALTRLIKALQR